MGFKIHKSKSWKNAAKKHSKKAGKAITDKDGWENVGNTLTDKDNWEHAGSIGKDGWDGLTDKETWDNIGNDSKKTFNAASKGIGRAVDSLGLPDFVWYFAGFVVVGGVIIYATPENSSSSKLR
jgi:hypothetical protein